MLVVKQLGKKTARNIRAENGLRMGLPSCGPRVNAIGLNRLTKEMLRLKFLEVFSGHRKLKNYQLKLKLDDSVKQVRVSD